MGGKSKQTQRTKNNARPSNSGRSAELLGSTIPAFVGFSAHSDLGMVPFAPGFSTMDSLPDTFDASVGAQYQLVMRKMCKKDPITKVKALQEFQTLVSESDSETIKSILPLWPKFYHNLANDVEHRVRETAQQAQSTIATKSGKSIAPFLKQIAPVWIASQYDNYAPAASIATTSFKASFAENKIQEVLNYCQNEILDYIIRNLTFHTASTLNSTKSCSAEDAENKYQRVVIGSLKTLAFFVEKTYSSTEGLNEKYQQILQNQKFWSFSKHKTTNIRAAWFELMYVILQYAPAILETNRVQIMQICFQNMDEMDPLVSPHIWGCILVIQTVFIDWHDIVNIKKTIQPKFNSLFKNVYNGNATIFGPIFLPFLAKLNEININDLELYEFYNQLFENMKKSMISTPTIVQNVSRSDIAGLTIAFYECLRFVIKNINSEVEENNCKHEIVAYEYFEIYIIDIIKWSFQNDHIITKYIFRHCSALIAYWSNNIEKKLYSNILKKFWLQLSNIIMEQLSNSLVTEININQIIEFIQILRNATPSLSDNKVKFAEQNNKCNTIEKNKVTSEHILKELKLVVIQLVRNYIAITSTEYKNKYVIHLKTLCEMFNDKEFYKNISKENDLMVTLNQFKVFIKDKDQPSEEIIDIIFEIIFLLEKNQQFEQLRSLLEIRNNTVQKCILQRMLSYPLCIEPEIRLILGEKNVVDIILNIAKDVIKENSKEKFNLLHKCFFQIDSGKILINSEAVNGIIEIMSEPLTNPNGLETMIDTCGSFIAQIMPVISDNSTQEQQNNIFLKLFKFSIDMVVNDNLSEDTLWEITTCWQDALSSEDITMNDDLISKCSNIVENRINTITCDLSILEINNIADIVAKLILCSTENIDSINDRYEIIDKYLLILLESKQYEKLEYQLIDLCSFFETLHKIITTNNLDSDCTKDISIMELKKIFRHIYFKFSIIFRLICNIKDEKKPILIKDGSPEDEQEYTEDYCDPEENLLKILSDNIYNFILNSMKYAAIGESFLQNSDMLTDEIQTLVLNLSEKIILMLQHSNDNFMDNLKCRLCELATNEDLSWIRVLPCLLNIKPYNLYEENGSIVLFEELSEQFLAKNNYLGYINFIQMIVSKLTRKALPKSKDILQTSIDITLRSGYYRSLLANHLDGDVNDIEDRKLINECISFITDVGEEQQSNNNKFIYNENLSKREFSNITAVTEFMNLLTECIERFPTELSIRNWDSIRIGLCSWILSVAKSIEDFNDPKVAIFVSACYLLFAALSRFIKNEKTKSSTQFLSNIIDEWENLFSREVNLVLFKSFYNLVLMEPKTFSTCYNTVLDVISPTIEYIDFKILFDACKNGFKISLNDLIKFVLDNLYNKNNTVRIACLYTVKKLSQDLIKLDLEILEKRNEILQRDCGYSADDWHYLNQFTSHINDYGLKVEQYISEFSYKMTELSELKPINQKDALTYFYIWDCIIEICSKAPAELRSVYATWISDHKYEQTLLNFLFRAMPVEILKNHDTKALNNDIFKSINWIKIKDDTISVERWACYLYSQMLRYLPAVVRKWWSSANARQKLFVDKLTTNYVSNLIWQEDLKAIHKKDKHENMQITVHTSTREVIAIYSIDEARMELIITLAQNHPLGAVKVESGKQIGGRASSRNVGMQLTIFLTHQNGSIFDGLSLWKKNLDKKFSGVEECYICYTVIHQDTCQLPKLTCKTCKKRFHGPCLYKWFTTSSKSTCPLCRNVF